MPKHHKSYNVASQVVFIYKHMKWDKLEDVEPSIREVNLTTSFLCQPITGDNTKGFASIDCFRDVRSKKPIAMEMWVILQCKIPNRAVESEMLQIPRCKNLGSGRDGQLIVRKWWVRDKNFWPAFGQPPSGLANFPPKSQFFQFFPSGQKNLSSLGQKTPRSKQGGTLFTVGQKYARVPFVYFVEL